MAKTTIIGLNGSGPDGAGLPFWGNLENETDIESRAWHMPETTRRHCVVFDAKPAGA